MSARCATVDPEIWFAHEEYRRRTKLRAAAEERAKAICGRCALLDACREYGLATRQEYGIWGGLTEDDRKNVLARGSDATWTSPLQIVESTADPEHSEAAELGEMKAA